MAEDAIGLMDALEIESAHRGRRLHGRHDRAGNRHLVSRARAFADLDHVDDGQSQIAAANPRSRRDADGAAARRRRKNTSRGSPRPGKSCAPAIFRKRKRSTARAPNARSSAASIPPASAGNSAPSWPQATARKGWRSVKAPTLVIHGTVDPLVRPEGGKDTAASIPGAKLLMIEGMGHALPIPMWPQIIDAIDKHAHAASAKTVH